MNTITATSILSSVHAVTGDRLDTLLLRMPRCILAEFNTHRVFSRNAASSRAIPVAKLIADVEADPFVPLVWTKNEPGMQGREECNEGVRLPENAPSMCRLRREDAWLYARDQAVEMARQFAEAGYHKQIINRLLEPYAHVTVVVSSTTWDNFLSQRDHADAEPHMQMLAKEIRTALNGATPQVLAPGEWHLPFVKSLNGTAMNLEYAKILSVARCASTSFKTTDGFDMTLERAEEIYRKLTSGILHASPFEHQAIADEYVNGAYANSSEHRNFVGFRQHRALVEGALG